MNILVHHGVKGQKWGVRRQRIVDNAAKIALKRSEMYSKDASNYSKTKGGKQYAKASINAKKYFDKKAEYFSNISTSKVSRKDVKLAKKFIRHYSHHVEAEFSDYYRNGKKYNYLNSLDSLEKKR